MLFQTQTKIILASASPRRKMLLESCGISFEVRVYPIEEKPKEDELATAYVLRNALEKGLCAYRHSKESASFTDDLDLSQSLFLSADTIVVTQKGSILEKPLSTEHARQMLSELSNNSHLVYTAYAFIQNNKEIISRTVETKVTFRKLRKAEIDSYIASGEPFDKAGSYGIQGPAMGFVERIEGSYTNVMGLPLSHVLEDLNSFVLAKGSFV